jgi:hypothetical protein
VSQPYPLVSATRFLGPQPNRFLPYNLRTCNSLNFWRHLPLNLPPSKHPLYWLPSIQVPPWVHWKQSLHLLLIDSVRNSNPWTFQCYSQVWPKCCKNALDYQKQTRRSFLLQDCWQLPCLPRRPKLNRFQVPTCLKAQTKISPRYLEPLQHEKQLNLAESRNLRQPNHSV